MNRYQEELQRLEQAHLTRSLKTSVRGESATIRGEGDTLVDFSSNDYLGLSRHPRLIETAIRATERYGVGSGASRLISGTSPAHAECEEVVAECKQAESALLFANGYMTALGVLTSLCSKDDVIILDKLAHACLIDGARASGARMRVFPHNNVNRLEALLKSERERLSAGAQIIIVIESVYSMDGDLCPLAEIVRLKNEYGALLLMDEAHGLGVLGPCGMGLAEELGLQDEVELQMGTLGKAAGGAGGYIACSRLLRDMMVNKARSLIFTTAPPPAQAAVAAASFDLMRSAQDLRSRLTSFREYVSQALGGIDVPSAICPIIIGENGAALAASTHLRDAGFVVPAVRYPTVPRGSARLRLTLSAAHTMEQVAQVIELVQLQLVRIQRG